ncbi:MULTISPECIES: NAD(P)-dependent oxidoreductase [unclassified Wenzhouxiangella]|uniref:NAD(P)-dependent oxidoreductase n=1 Tax=unclassified Wenzhouxiangella TaxID=2613841 RepID=UPI000E32CD1C|nr:MULTISPECIES: NAD(P)-dependent oxidoreductase [unclassified Wenzhouxiangella]RFF27391.1 NAD(P)-dependent oxidoreductase [Wenzhouxiangella sp. 15181]RFP68819.1 NAD(P)-dependent oxidoreductase [Wenzhouxiangella sp. 15190]
MKTGWIGLGAMGEPMAGHLLDHGHLAAVWNRSGEKAKKFASERQGVTAADSPAALAAEVDVICLCVSADDDLREVVSAMRDSLRAGQVVIDHSTVAPATARQLAADLAELGVAFIDAPVTGGVEGAKNGQLAIMAGGEKEDVERVRTVMDSYARVMHHLGPSGAGQSAKAVNQLMVAGIAEAVCESLALMERLDLPREPMLELLGGGAAGNWFLDKRGRTMLEDSYQTGFDPRLLLKDLKICDHLCREAGFDSAVLAQALDDYQRLIDGGETGRDISALYRIKSRQA